MPSITAGMVATEDAAITTAGNAYATDASPGRLLVYDANNKRLKFLAIEPSVAVAVGTGG